MFISREFAPFWQTTCSDSGDIKIAKAGRGIMCLFEGGKFFTGFDRSAKKSLLPDLRALGKFGQK